MANDFKRETKSGLSNNSGSPTSLYTCASSKSSIIIGFTLTNKTTNDVTVHAYIDTAISGDEDAFLCHNLTVPASSTVELTMGKVVLTHDGSNGDVVKAYASAASAIDVVLSILEDVNS